MENKALVAKAFIPVIIALKCRVDKLHFITISQMTKADVFCSLKYPSINSQCTDICTCRKEMPHSNTRSGYKNICMFLLLMFDSVFDCRVFSIQEYKCRSSSEINKHLSALYTGLTWGKVGQDNLVKCYQALHDELYVLEMIAQYFIRITTTSKFSNSKACYLKL